MAVPVILLLLLLLSPFLPSTALAAFAPDFSAFLACGAASDVSLAARTFTPDAPFLTSSRVPAVPNADASPAAPLYAAARASSSSFTYKFGTSASAGQYLVLRLHFFPFASSHVRISSARFAVSVLAADDAAFTLLSSFAPPSGGVVKEFFVPAPSSGGGGDFRVTFTPDVGSAAFVNAVELFSAPPELLWDLAVKPVGALVNTNSNSNDVSSVWRHHALETVHRLNVGGPTLTDANDTLWRTWLPDAAFLAGPPDASVVNATTNPIAFVGNYTRAVAPDAVYQTQRATNAAAQELSLAKGPFNVTWSFPADPAAEYLVRLHFCDYEMLSSVVDVGIVFDVFVAGDIGYRGLMPSKIMTRNNQAFYLDYAAAGPGLAAAPGGGGGNLNVSIGMSSKSSPGEGGGFLNGLEIMKLHRSTSTSTSSSSKKKRVVLVALGSVLGASVLACAVLCFFLVLRRRRRQRPAPEDEKESTQLPWSSPYTQQQQDEGSSWLMDLSTSRSGTGTGTGRLQRVVTAQLHIPLAEIKAATDNFHQRNLIGVGGFGNVYRGVLPGPGPGDEGTRVAVKRAMRATKQGLPEFHTEILVLSAIRHRHLVSLIGYCHDHGEMILVYEYMEHGTLRSHLYGDDSSDKPALSWKQRLEICIGAARGLHYLHTGHADNIIHRDVKSTNILLGGDALTAKVADFGLSRVGPAPALGETHVSTAVKGSFGYLDPEYFKTQQLTDRSDVYSFGVVLFEVLCARPVIDQTREDRGQVNLAEWALANCRRDGDALRGIADPRIAGQVNENSLRKFAETAAKCLADYGVDRPSMGDVLWNLEYCLQLQETHVRREAFEDSGTAATQFPDDVVLPTWMPSSVSTTSFLTLDDDSAVTVTDDDVAAANSKVFSHLSTSAHGR